jgi:cellulose synthase/poly-beta-1,6-N-acetylglucosamine synthase-like glycosyltransferase
MVIFLLIFFLLLIVYAVLIDYYRRAWNKLSVFSGSDFSPRTNISIIIAARNEENNINVLLDSLCQQSYPTELTEVIIVDDHSEDNTWSLLNNYPAGNRRFSFIKLADHINKDDRIASHKKKAIETAISQATGTLIVTTDADCLFHPDWLLTIARFYETHSAKFIAAPVKIKTTRSLLAIFQTLDFLTLQGITGASVYKRIHSMCNGANLAYEKDAFNEVGGFLGIDNLPSGDDMLLMHKIYKKYPNQVYYLKHESAIVTTAATSSWKSFFQQRIRWASKADSYDDKRIFWVLLLVYSINLSFLALGVAAFFDTIWAFFFLLFLLAKILIEFPFVNTVAAFFRQQMLMNYFILMQPLHILYTIIAGWLGKFGSFEWKGRTTNVK